MSRAKRNAGAAASMNGRAARGAPPVANESQPIDAPVTRSIDLTALQARYRRGCILTSLAAGRPSGMSIVLVAKTVADCGYRADLEHIVKDLHWLAIEGMVSWRSTPAIDLVALTQRGRSIVTGDLIHAHVEVIEEFSDAWAGLIEDAASALEGRCSFDSESLAQELRAIANAVRAIANTLRAEVSP